MPSTGKHKQEKESDEPAVKKLKLADNSGAVPAGALALPAPQPKPKAKGKAKAMATILYSQYT